MANEDPKSSRKDANYWERVNLLFDAVVSLPEGSRPAKLLEIGNQSPELIDDLCLLIGAHARADNFLETPAARLSPTALSSIVSRPRTKPHPLAEGTTLGDYDILSQVGEGSFARVYKAFQRSLQRVVAIKISSGVDREARTMAGLEHDHIVRVFSEQRLPEQNAHLICMQYVEGMTLAALIQRLCEVPRSLRTGATIIDILDRYVTGTMTFDAGALKDRELISSLSFFSACLWIGARMAEALDFAHSRGVLHLDVKPANILINRYGRPLLTDFNVAMNLSDLGVDRPVLLGGTVDYMSPEQDRAFRSAQGRPWESEVTISQPGSPAASQVEAKSDIYSLGIVLAELMLCDRARVGAKGREDNTRIRNADSLPDEVSAVLHRAVMQDPNDRFASGRDFALALDNCRRIRKIHEETQRDDRWLKYLRRSPLLALLLAAVVPQVLGSIVNISYNSLRIAADLTGEQEQTFMETILPYNLVVYPLGILIVARQVMFIINNIRQRRDRILPDPTSMAALRMRALDSPKYLFAACSVGWLPGALIFPMIIDWRSGPITADVYAHFGISFVTSWLIALTYSYFLLELLVMVMLYSKFWSGCCDLEKASKSELAPVRTRMKLFQLLAGAIPLFGVLMIVTTSSSVMSPEHYKVFQTLIIVLIAMAICGFMFAIKISDKISGVILLYTPKAK